MINWHVIHTYPSYERKVADKLRILFGDNNSFCPSVRSKSTVRGQISERVVGAYSGYTFARWDHSENKNLWYKVKEMSFWRGFQETRPIIDIMGGEFPWPVLPGVVEDWLARADADGVVPGLEPQTPRLKLGYGPGDNVRLTYGAFENVPAYCDWLDAAGAHLQIRGLLGRNQGVYVPFVTGALLTLDTDSATSGSGLALNRKRGRRGGISSRLAKRRRLIENVAATV